MEDNIKINLYIDLTNIDDANNKSASVTKALKNAYDNRNDFISFVRLYYSQSKAAEISLNIEDLIQEKKLKYNTLIKMSGATFFSCRGTKAVLIRNVLTLSDDFSIMLPSEFHILITKRDTEFNFDTTCVEIICKEDEHV